MSDEDGITAPTEKSLVYQREESSKREENHFKERTSTFMSLIGQEQKII